MCIHSLKGNCFVYDVKFHGVHFPLDGPVMQKKTLGWEPSTERLYPRDGMLKGDVPMALKIEGGALYLCDFKTVYKYVFYKSLVGTVLQFIFFFNELSLVLCQNYNRTNDKFVQERIS